MCFFGNMFFSQSNFPNEWLGSYEGIMYIEYPSERDSTKIEFELLETDKPNVWKYKVSYINEKWGMIVKDYQLLWNDTLSSKNHFILDEKNGLLIDEIFLNNSFYAHFEVGANHFQSVLQRKNNDLYYEIRCSTPQKGLKTQTTDKDEKGEFYNVHSFVTYTIQYAVLKRKTK
jgi:hypothetical protein